MNVKEKTSFTKKTSPEMFDHIAKQYDKLNRVMTFGLDRSWRKALNQLMPKNPEHWLDAATGTGDQILFSLQRGATANKITGIDLSEEMLKLGANKLRSFTNVTLQKASITNIPFNDLSCDVITCSFGIRNVDLFQDALLEFYRVLKKGGILLILESSRPTNPILNFSHNFYMKKVLPKLALLFGSDPKAYTYLAKTTSLFPSGKEFCDILETLKFINIKAIPMALGSVTLYYAQKT